MANSKGKVDKGTGPAELEQERCIFLPFESIFPCSRISCSQETHFLFMESYLSGLKMSGSTKCSDIQHIVAVHI